MRAKTQRGKGRKEERTRSVIEFFHLSPLRCLLLGVVAREMWWLRERRRPGAIVGRDGLFVDREKWCKSLFDIELRPNDSLCPASADSAIFLASTARCTDPAPVQL
jgi:hypothetical protein